MLVSAPEYRTRLGASYTRITTPAAMLSNNPRGFIIRTLYMWVGAGVTAYLNIGGNDYFGVTNNQAFNYVGPPIFVPRNNGIDIVGGNGVFIMSGDLL